MTVLEEREITDWHGVCRSCGKVGDGHTLHCKTLRLKPGWILRVPMEFSDDPFEAACQRREVISCPSPGDVPPGEGL